MPLANTDLRITTLMTRVGLIAAAALALIIGVMWGPAGSAHAADATVTDAAGIQAAFDDATGDDNLITLGGNITADEDVPLVVPDGATVTLDLNGYSLTTTGATSSAGITVERGSTLAIQDSGTGGTITATGGALAPGLGGADSSDGGTIKIAGGIVIATGGFDGAGIGGGYEGTAGTTTIAGGTITATGGFDAAGIGGGYYGTAGTTAITGGTVIATGGESGAGIGGGYHNTSSGTITITGGTVTATGGDGSAGIGGGYIGDGAAVSIGAGADVTASSSDGIAVGSGSGGTSFGSLSNAGSLTIPSGKGITVPDTTTITNSGTITVDGTIDNAGVIEGSGTLAGAGSIANSGAITQSVTVRDTLSVTGNNYLLTFDANNADAMGTPENMRVYAATLDAAEASLPTKQPSLDEHTFTGWYSAPTAGEEWNETTIITGDATLYAQWRVNSYTVTFDTQGGSAVAAENVDYGTPVTAPDDPTRDGYTFTGWFTAADDGTAWDFSANVTEDITLYAQWSINSYTVAFDTQGGTSLDGQTVEFGDPVTTPGDPTRDGYTFAGWTTDATGGTPWNFGTPVSEDLTLYAQWNEDATVTPPADDSDATGGTGGTNSDSQSSGSTDALPRTGADVTGWPFAGAALLILAGGALLALRRRRHA
ncbi:InlB B-repeat-containing protein [Paramicrobacterium fandaimingii]|uniref:InlB B-repeat-containing protein n=1 Tax=Paramicrobacterium fandaimingii TaxID=2708079 RepID=UPI00142493F6|nr:InlB B-repeat-containing protein [Microbacterium fandaimingii]